MNLVFCSFYFKISTDWSLDLAHIIWVSEMLNLYDIYKMFIMWGLEGKKLLHKFKEQRAGMWKGCESFKESIKSIKMVTADGRVKYIRERMFDVLLLVLAVRWTKNLYADGIRDRFDHPSQSRGSDFRMRNMECSRRGPTGPVGQK